MSTVNWTFSHFFTSEFHSRNVHVDQWVTRVWHFEETGCVTSGCLCRNEGDILSPDSADVSGFTAALNGSKVCSAASGSGEEKIRLNCYSVTVQCLCDEQRDGAAVWLYFNWQKHSRLLSVTVWWWRKNSESVSTQLGHTMWERGPRSLKPGKSHLFGFMHSFHRSETEAVSTFSFNTSMWLHSWLNTFICTAN